MEFNQSVQHAFLNCINYGDSEELEELINRSGTGMRMDYYDCSNSCDGDIGRTDIFILGAEAETTAHSLGLKAFATEYDGNGFWVFSARSEGHIIVELQKAATTLAKRMHGRK